jgi:mono/diheme cytochrome c family protein
VAGIPEHLLKRAQEARDKAAGKTPTADTPTEAQNLPAKTSETKPAAAPQVASAPPPPPPDPSYVVAAKTRKKVPFWAMAALSLLPFWAFMYLLAVKPQEKTVEGPMAIGAGVFGTCAGCHGANGAGGAGRTLYQGEVLKTFPKIEDMLNFVYAGSQQFVSAGIKVYGDPNREGGAHAPLSYNGNPMPQQGEKFGGGLTDAEILGVVCHERYEIGGADPESEKWKSEYETWCSPESEIFLGLENGSVNYDNLAETFAALPNPPSKVGTDARPTGK